MWVRFINVSRPYITELVRLQDQLISDVSLLFYYRQYSQIIFHLFLFIYLFICL